MIANSDPRDSLRINLQPEEALKIGKLLGYMYGAVALCRDGHRTSQMIEQALMSGIIATGGDVYLAGECPAPAMPFMSTGADCYVSIAADDPERICGINIHNPDGSYFDEGQVHALLSKEERVIYPEYSELGQTYKIFGMYGKYLDYLSRIIRKCNCQFVMDGTYATPTSYASRILSFYDSESIIIHRTSPSFLKPIVEDNYYDIVRAMESYPSSLGAALSNDGSRVVMFDEEHRRIPSVTLAAMFAEILDVSPITVPLDASLAVDDIAGSNIVVKTKRNIKHVVDQMVANKSGLGMDTHGRFVFADTSLTPDGISAMLRIGEHSFEEKICDFVDRMPLYPCFTKRVPYNVPEEDLRVAMDLEISAAEYESIIRMDAIRLDFENGWILFDINPRDQCVEILCEARDNLYAIGLLDIGMSIVESAIRSLD